MFNLISKKRYLFFKKDFLFTSLFTLVNLFQQNENSICYINNELSSCNTMFVMAGFNDVNGVSRATDQLKALAC